MAQAIKAKNKPLLTVVAPPHMKTSLSTKSIMRDVIIALLPAAVWAVGCFGYKALMVMLIAMITCQITEWVCLKIMKRDRAMDNSAMLTGLLFALCLPADTPWYVVVIGSMFAIIIVKQMFGGIGMNILNPALAARVFVGLSFPDAFSQWAANAATATDAVTSATPLTLSLKARKFPELFQQMSTELGKLDFGNMFFGMHTGAIGEISSALLILGGIYLIWRKVISWHIPVSFILTVWLLVGLGWITTGDVKDSTYMITGPWFHIFAGGLMLGAFFMATDYVTSPITKRGQIVFGISCGLLTFLIRFFGNYPEGVMYSILFMNLMVPIIEWILPTPNTTWWRKQQKIKKIEDKKKALEVGA